MTSRTDSRIRSTPSPARNASSSSDATDWDNAIGGNLPGEYLPVHTENPADGPLTQAGSPTTRNPTTPGDSHPDGTDAADPAYRGVAAGVLNSAAQVGTAVGVALLTPLTSTATGSAVTAGYRIGFAGAGLIALAGALSSFLVPQSVLMTCSRSEAVASPDREQVQDQRLLAAQCVHRKARTTSSAEASANSPISDSRTASTESRSADPSALRSTGSAASASVDSRRVVGNRRMPRRSSSSGDSAAGSTSTGSGRCVPAATPSKPAAKRPASSK